MSVKPGLFLLVSLLGVSALGGSALAADPERGAALYESRCGACHSISRNRIGPRHEALFGRQAGTQAGYAYSQALVASGVLWDDETLDQWLRNPQLFIPGQKMGYRLRNPGERADIIAFLKAASGHNGATDEKENGDAVPEPSAR